MAPIEPVGWYQWLVMPRPYSDLPWHTIIVYLPIVITVIGAGLAGASMLGLVKLVTEPLDVRGKHCYVTGGSSGLGKAVAQQLMLGGANITLVARDKAKLESVVNQLKARASPKQTITSISADLVSASESARAIDESIKLHGCQPDFAFLCAGFSQPQWFVEADEEELRRCHDGSYWVQAFSAHAILKRLIAAGKTGSKVVFVSSFLGYTSFAGYSTYAPAKFALRGLADSLRSEMLPFGIDIHIFMPMGILSPGYKAEARLKPAVTKTIEKDDKPMDASEVARGLIEGLEKGHYQITADLTADLVRVVSNGAVPSNGLVWDSVLMFISWIGLPMWTRKIDKIVRKAGPAMRDEYLSKGLINQSS